MGFAFYYRSTRPVTPTEAANIERAADELIRGNTWLSCEPVCFDDDRDDGHMFGGSKPNFQPDEDDVAAAKEALPDGTTKDLFEILRKLSHSHAIDWEISHDYSDGPIGFIRNGVCDSEVLTQSETFANLGGMLTNVSEEFESPIDIPRTSFPTQQSNLDDDDPPILKFKPKRQ